MNINIPDKIYKLLILIGLITVGYGEYKFNNERDEWRKNSDQLSAVNDSLQLSLIKLKYNSKNLKDSGDEIIKNIKIANSDKIKKVLSDSLDIVINQLKYSNYKGETLLEKQKQYSSRQKAFDDELKFKQKINDISSQFGVALFMFGLLLWILDESKNSNSLIKQNEKIYTRCQSCAKKFSSMLGYGTNKDLSSNYSFCENCYSNGNFSNPTLSKKELFENSLEEIDLKDRNWLSKKILIFRINSIERWGKFKY